MAPADYWNPPGWAMRAGCPLQREALGRDYGEAKRRCDEILNPQFQGWLKRGEAGEISSRPQVGTFDWLVSTFKSSPKYRKLPARTQRSYDAVLQLVSDYELKDGRRFGVLALESIVPGTADRLYERLLLKADGSERRRTANLAMQVCRRAWKVALRDKSELVPPQNPFAKMDLEYRPKPTRPATHDELSRFVAAADQKGEASVGTAAMIAFYWLQRQADILQRLTWGHYRPVDAPGTVRIFHHKTGELVSLPLCDDDGSGLWPELTARLDAMSRLGSLIVMRDRPDRFRKVHLPWQVDYFRHRVAAIRKAAGIDDDVKFMGLRHGGNTEGANAGFERCAVAGVEWAQDDRCPFALCAGHGRAEEGWCA